MTIVTATVPIAVNCIAALRVKFAKTSPRKNWTLPQSTKVIASLVVVQDAPVLEPDDASPHPVDDRLIVGRDQHGRALEVDALQQFDDLGRIGRVDIPGRFVAEQDL